MMDEVRVTEKDLNVKQEGDGTREGQDQRGDKRLGNMLLIRKERMWDETGVEWVWEDIRLERHGYQVIWSLFSQCGSSKGKGTVHPITGHEGPEGEQRYSCTLPLTSALDGGGWSTPHPSCFTPAKDLVPIVQEAGLDGCGKSRPHWDSIPRPFSLQHVTILTELYRPCVEVVENIEEEDREREKQEVCVNIY